MAFHKLPFILLILLCFSTREMLCDIPQVSLPVITAITRDNGWKYLNSQNTTIIGEDPQIFVEIVCTAPYPVKWSTQGYTAQGQTVRVAFAKTTISPQGKVIHSLQAADNFYIPTTVKTTCAHFNNSLIASSIHIIVDDSPYGRLILNNVTTEGKQTLIPCVTTDPRSSVELFKRHDGAFRRYESATYEPTLGFTLHQPQAGHFKCRGSSNEVEVVIHDHYKNLPIVMNRMWFTDEIVSINCNPSGKIEIQILANYDNATTIEDEPNSLILYKKLISKSTLECRNYQGVLTSILHYSVADAPGLIFGNSNGKIACLSSARNKSASVVKCNNANDCELLKRCFVDVNCQKKSDTYTPEKIADEFCQEENYDCIKVQTAVARGLIQCSVYNKARSRIFQFFTGLKQTKYLSWRDAPIGHLIRMPETDFLFYANESTTFYCEAVKFLFADSFHYNVTFFNGSAVRLRENKDYENVDEKEIKSRKVSDINIVSGIKIFLPVGAVRLTCYVYLITEPVHRAASRNFTTVKYLSKPMINRKNTNVKLARGGKGELDCKSSGHPTPTMKWTRKNENFSGDSRYETKITNDGEAILQFKNKVVNSDAGEYVCSSVNRIGNDSVTFKVTVEVPEETAMLYRIIYGTLAAILLLVLIAWYFWKKQKLAMNLLRQLTEAEIDEFLNGNREMWLLNLENQQENINYMPYNNEYEIPVDKILFDRSSILGNGEFGLVVTAKFNNTKVAVKSTKPEADVLFFKSLLSELKIMAFIGHHENIVKFIGSNTANIKDRKVYIVLELCSLGSLQNVLRKSKYMKRENLRSTLIKNNYENNVVLTDDSLLRWCYEIACAMEYLAKKKVVHADLATRNILLNENQVVKLADFGLSLKLYTDNNYSKKTQTVLPYRWMAIESLKHLKFSTESDVWSYGVTVWEIFSFGEVPYPQESWSQNFVHKLVKGMRLEITEHCPEEVYYYALRRCWDEAPHHRPTFPVLVEFFSNQLKHQTNEAKYTELTEYVQENGN